MSEWKDLLIVALGSTPFMGLITWWLKSRRDERLAREIAYVGEIKTLQGEVKSLQQEIRDLLQDRIRYEMVRRESSDQTGKLLIESVTLLRDMTQKLALLKADQRGPQS